ncbi:MAG: anti-sigma factor [Actinomycetota bacterium]|nr:anti-sigma factor [Actinomycetota bacterium]
MTAMHHYEIEQLLGAYALDALEADEADVVEVHLRDCPRCRAEVVDHREVAAMLAFGGGEAPPGIWERIQASLEEAPPKLELARVVPLHQSRLRSIGVRLLTAAAVIISVIALGVALTRTSSTGGEVAIDGEIAELAADPATKTVHLVEAGGPGRVNVLLAGDRGFLVKHSLPKLPEGQTYQLWGQRGSTKVSLGVLGAEPKRTQFAASGADYEALAITVEPAGGASQPTGAAVAAGWVPPR